VDDALAILRKTFPDRKFVEDFKYGTDLGKVPTERGNELLLKHYGKGWKGLEDVVKENLQSFGVL
jgi:hypothetical protein